MKQVLVEPKLHKILKERKISQVKFAAMIGVSQSFVSKFNRTLRHDMDLLFLIADALGLKIEDLFEFTVVESMEDKIT